MSVRKTVSILFVVVLALTVAIPATAEGPLWYIVTGSVTALANQSLTSGRTFLGAIRDGWKVRADIELRLDAALMELKLRDPEHFDAVFEKYALRFNADPPSLETAFTPAF